MAEEEKITEVEEAVSNLFMAFYHLRQAEKYQEEYDVMGTVISMLIEDREHLRRKYLTEKKD